MTGGDDSRIAALPHLGGKTAVILFVFTLSAFVAESQLTQYVQSSLGYRQPFFLFYVVHSAFLIIFPLHLLYLALSTRTPPRPFLRGLLLAIRRHLAPQSQSLLAGQPAQFPTFKFFRLSLGLTLGATAPGLLWFSAISLAPVSDVTAIWNTNAFFAYVITVKLFKLGWEIRKLAAVSIATLGVLAVIYGGIQEPDAPSKDNSSLLSTKAPLIGDLLTVVASVGYGFYQVLYKRYAALPSDPEFASSDAYTRASASGDEFSEDVFEDVLEDQIDVDTVYPPPFGLHANFLTAIIGFCTFTLLSVFIPILHYSGVETFRLPPNSLVVLSIAGIAGTGVIFNAGFMILLGVWGPIIASVGNLLTIVLVFLSDILLGETDVITVWSLMGAGGIILAFGILVYDMLQRR